MLAQISQYVKTHEKLMAFVLAVVLVWFVVGKIDARIAARDSAALQADKITAALQVQKDEELAKQAADQAAQYKLLTEKVEQQNAALEQANVALATALATQQKKDQLMTLPELATRWAQLVPNAGLSVQNGQLAVSEPGAHATVDQLERVPVLQTQLVNETTEKTQALSLVTSANQNIGTLNLEITGLRTEIMNNDKVCKDQIAVKNDEIKKARKKGFWIGYVLGFLTRQVIKTETGH